MINKLPKNTLTVQSLIGRNEISFYLECLNSLIKYSNDKINLVLHTVDKFSDREKNLLEKSLSNCTFEVLNAQKNAEKTLDYLCNYPNCQKFRKRSLWGVEFFDPLFARPDEHVSFYIDADILFIRPFEGLFNKEVVQNGAAFLRDTQWDAYSLRPWQLWGIEKKPAIVKGITTALVFWHKNAIDWDYLEWFLGQIRYHKISEWVLPTAQAGLATLCKAKTVKSSQIINMYPNAKIKCDTFGIHLLGSYRQSWYPKIAKYKSLENSALKPIAPRFETCQPRSPIGYGVNQAKRWINTRLNSW